MTTTATHEELTMMISLRLPLSHVVWLDQHARDEGQTRSKLVREMLTSERHIPELP